MNTGCHEFQRSSRRQFCRIGGLGFFGLSMAGLYQARAEEPAKKRRANQMIVIWLGGGPPHQDMFDMKPDGPTETRGEFKPIATNVPGREICELMPELAKVADKYTIIRSCGIGNET